MLEMLGGRILERITISLSFAWNCSFLCIVHRLVWISEYSRLLGSIWGNSFSVSETVFLCNPSWLHTDSNSPASASGVLGLQMCITKPSRNSVSGEGKVGWERSKSDSFLAAVAWKASRHEHALPELSPHPHLCFHPSGYSSTPPLF